MFFSDLVEFVTAARHIGFTVSDESLKALFLTSDVDSNGFLDEEEAKTVAKAKMPDIF